MKAIHQKMKGYTIVITPHAIDARQTRFDGKIHNEDIFEAVDGVRHRMRPDQVSGTVISIQGVEIANVYMRRIFNEYRKREEIEVISITSCEHFRTHGYNENGESHLDTVWVMPRKR